MQKINLLILFTFLCLFSTAQSLNDRWLEQIDKGKEEYAVNNYNAALTFFQTASKMIPTDTTAYVYLLDCSYKIQNVNAFSNSFDKLTLLGYHSARMYNLAINLSIDVNKDYGKAVQYVEFAKQKFPNDSYIQMADVMIYYRYGDFKASKEKLQAILEKDKKNKKAIDLLYKIQYDIEQDYTAALQTLEMAQLNFPDDAEYPKKMVNIYFETNQMDQAESKFRQLIALNPNDAKSHYNLSLILYNKGEYQQSVELASKAIELDPNFIDAIFNVGTFFYYRALQYNQALVDMSPYQYTYNLQGRDIEQTAKSYFDAAKPYFERAIQLNTNELSAYENLNTINALLENINNNTVLSEPYFSDLENENKHKVYPLYEIDTFAFVYPASKDYLDKGDAGQLEIDITNISSSPLTELKLVIMQPLINTWLEYQSVMPIASLNGGESRKIRIPIKYVINTPGTKGIEKAEGAKDLLRFFITGAIGRYTDLKQVELTLGKALVQEPVLAENYSETMDIDFSPQKQMTNFLLVIGIDEYQGWPKLTNAVSDAKNIKDVLTSKYAVNTNNVYELYNADATKDKIINELIKIKGEITAKDNLIIYYAGHGEYNTATDKGSWVPVDAPLNSENSYLDNGTLLNFLSALDTRHTFLIADACFSGSLFVSGDDMTYKPNNDKIRSRWGFTSGNLEYVADGASGEGSPFARYLAQALIENQREYIAVTELISYVKFKVRNNNLQTPIGRPLNVDGNDGGEFLLYTK